MRVSRAARGHVHSSLASTPKEVRIRALQQLEFERLKKSDLVEMGSQDNAESFAK